MATKQEIINGMQEVVAQAKRVSKLLDDQGDWDSTRPAGWTPKEMFCHLAAVSGMLATTGPGMLAAPESADFTASTNIADLNAQAVSSMSGMTPQQLTQAIEVNYGKAIEFVKNISDEQLQSRKTFAQMTMPAADLLGNIAVLHANHHLYEAALRVAF
jgi:hypothetical protein